MGVTVDGESGRKGGKKGERREANDPQDERCCRQRRGGVTEGEKPAAASQQQVDGVAFGVSEGAPPIGERRSTPQGC